jgi:hypothetical protein
MYTYLAKSILRYTYQETKDLGILDMNFHYEYMGFRGRQIRRLAKSGGGNFAPSLLSFSFESFFKFLQVLAPIYSRGFYISLSKSEV